MWWLVWLGAVEGGWSAEVVRVVGVGVDGRYVGWRWWWYAPLMPYLL